MSDASSSADMAVVVPICNMSTDYEGNNAQLQVVRAQLLATSLRSHGSNLTLVALVYGLKHPAMRRLRNAGFEIDDRSALDPTHFAMVPRFVESPTMKWPRANQSQHVQGRVDSACTSFKFMAWQLTRWRGLLMSDTDVVFRTDPRPWMQARLNEDEYFFAEDERSKRNYVGINSHLVWLQPNRQVFRMLIDAGRHGNFVPYTNSDQDVIESLFTQHRHDLSLPPSEHTKHAYCSCHSVLAFHTEFYHNLIVNHRRYESQQQWTRVALRAIDKTFVVLPVAELRSGTYRLCPDEAKLVDDKSGQCFNERAHQDSRATLDKVHFVRVRRPLQRDSDWTSA